MPFLKNNKDRPHNKINLSVIVGYLLMVLVAIFPGALIIVPSGGYIALYLLFFSIVGLWIQGQSNRLENGEIIFIIVFTTYFLIHILSFWWFDLNIKEIDTPSRFLLVLPIYFYLRNKVEFINWLYISVIVGAISAGLISIYQISIEDLDRVRGSIEPGRFGLISSVLSSMCIAGAIISKKSSIRLLFVLAACLGLLATFLSGTRGAWLSTILVTIALVIIVVPKYKFTALMLTLTVFMLSHYALMSNSNYYTERFIQAELGFVDYFSKKTKTWRDDERYTSSVGVRLELYKGAYRVAKRSPIIGFGEGNFDTNLAILADDGKISKLVLNYGHAHQEYFTTLVEQGLIGLMSLLALFLYPLLFFKKYLKSSDQDLRLLSTIGSILSLDYMLFSLTSGSLDHQSSTLFYALMMVIIFSLLHARLMRTSSSGFDM